MIKVLIVGENSYIGDSFKKYAENKMSVNIVDAMDNNWQKEDFSGYDVVICVAAIVHQNEQKIPQQLYYDVNTTLAFEVAQKAKNSNVSQFVFMSTMSVYGLEKGVITSQTQINPNTLYGLSKYKAEQMIEKLRDDNFKIAILRPPIVYGKGCKGNFVLMSKYAKRLPVFPDFKSQRSMIFVDNLCSFITKVINENMDGVFCPQDKEYVCTTNMVKLIAKNNGKKIRLTKFFNPIIKYLLKLDISLINKVFGTLIYDESLSLDFDTVDVQKAIELTEK